ncbi:MAG TPA: SRPBCC family protein [Egibacteraceae bacterium]|nr:SRPBCC family protein [Egibacteraceae bacterium]
MSETVRESILVKADADTIMDVIADFDAYPDWQPDFKSVEVLETDDDGWATKVRFVLDAMIMTTSYTLAYTYTDTSMSWHLVEGEQVRKVDGSYTLEDAGGGQTKVTYQLEVDPTISVPGILKRKATKKIVDSALKGMKQRVESLA